MQFVKSHKLSDKTFAARGGKKKCCRMICLLVEIFESARLAALLHIQPCWPALGTSARLSAGPLGSRTEYLKDN